MLRHEVAQAVDHEAIGLLGADGHAQRVRQPVIAQPPQHQAALGQEGIGIGRSLALLEWEMDQDEIATLGVTLRPSFVTSSVSQLTHFSVCTLDIC